MPELLAAPALKVEALRRDDPMLPTPARVIRRKRELADTFSLHIEADPAAFAPFMPGQFNMLYVFGVGEAAISLSGDPSMQTTLAHTVRDVGKVSGALTRLMPGDMLGVRGPFGTPWPLEEGLGKDVVVIAGGIGLAPLRPALLRLLAERHGYGRLALLYGARSPADILFVRELERWRRRLDLELEVTVDHARSDWFGRVGVVTELIPRLTVDADQTLALICGPEIMMRFAVQALNDIGVPDSAIHVSVERHMKCGLGHCGRCQLGPFLLCRDGPVLRADRLRPFLRIKEI